MANNPFQTKEFLKLQSVWNKKLKKSGFEDIEQPDGNLKLWSGKFFNDRFQKYGLAVFQAKEEYYRLAGMFLYEHQFENYIEKRAWQLHADGESIRTIVEELKRERIHAEKNGINRMLMKLTDLMLSEQAKKQDNG